MPSISIIGLGWLGLPLAKHLLSRGFDVSGSKTTIEGVQAAKSLGIHAFLLQLDAQDAIQTLQHNAQTDYLLINIPPGLRRNESAYLTRMQTLQQAFAHHTFKQVIMTSTTGVYSANDQRVTEADAAPDDDKQRTLLAAEDIAKTIGPCTVLRLAGLVGGERQPGRFLAGKKQLSGGNMRVNLVHRDDVIRAITCVLGNPKALEETFNVCTPDHMSKADFYTQAANALGLEAPTFLTETTADKTVDGSKLCHQLNFTYQFQSLTQLLVSE